MIKFKTEEEYREAMRKVAKQRSESDETISEELIEAIRWYEQELMIRQELKEVGPQIDPVWVAMRLFSIHTHAVLYKDEEIVYREKDIIALLKDLGLPEPDWDKFGEYMDNKTKNN